MGWTFDIAVAATHKYAVRESGDVIEIVEPPDGGVGIVVADGQGSGPSARLLARSVAGRAAILLAEGVRPDAVVQAACDALFAERGGKVSVALDVVRVARSGEIEIARASTNTLLTWSNGAWSQHDTPQEPAGRGARQAIHSVTLPIGSVTALTIVTDGVSGAGDRFGANPRIRKRLPLIEATSTADTIADSIFSNAMELDCGRPSDDMSVVALLIAADPSDQRIERRRIRRSVR